MQKSSVATMRSTLADDLTQDAFLGGKVMAWQPRSGYRAGVDPVLLAAACPARDGDTVLELGCGAGVASLCLKARVDVAITGVEVQDTYAALARKNGLEVVTCDLSDLPADLRNRSFQHVILNPPYYAPGAHVSAEDVGRAKALGEETPLATWLRVAAKRLRPLGWMTLIQRMDRLPDVLAALPDHMGSISVLPIQPREGRAPGLFVMRARQDGRASFRLLAPFVMHARPRHESDTPDYTGPADAVLRDAASLSFDD